MKFTKQTKQVVILYASTLSGRSTGRRRLDNQHPIFISGEIMAT